MSDRSITVIYHGMMSLDCTLSLYVEKQQIDKQLYD